MNALVTDAADGGRAELDTFARANYGQSVAEQEKIQANAAGTPEAVVEQLGRYVARGARHLVIRIAAPDIPTQLGQPDRLAALRPALNALPADARRR